VESLSTDLEQRNQEAFDRLFDRAKMHTSVGVYMAHSWPMETILLRICLEHEKMLGEILANLKKNERKLMRDTEPCPMAQFLLESPFLFQYTPLIQPYTPSQRRCKMARQPMTKSQIVSRFAEKFELSKKNATAIFDEVASLAIFETKKTGSFILPGIGKLVLVKRKARMGRNPATGAAIKIPAKTVLKMRISKAAKEAIVRKKK
jgi:DNA-binding protein HU-beta